MPVYLSLVENQFVLMQENVSTKISPFNLGVGLDYKNKQTTNTRCTLLIVCMRVRKEITEDS